MRREPYRGKQGKQERVVLTPREQETLRHLARGLSDGEIAHAMRLSVHTITTRLQVMRNTVGAKSSREMMAWIWQYPEAVTHGVVVLRDHDLNCQCCWCMTVKDAA